MSGDDDWWTLSERGQEAEARGDLEGAWECHVEASRLLGESVAQDPSLDRSALGFELLQLARLAALLNREGVAELFAAALECATHSSQQQLRGAVWHYVGAWMQRQELWVQSLLAYQEAIDALPPDVIEQRLDALQCQLVPLDRLQETPALLATLRQLEDAGVRLGATADLPSISSVLDLLQFSAEERRSFEQLLVDPPRVQAVRDDLLFRAREAVPDFVRSFEEGEFTQPVDADLYAQQEAFNLGVQHADAGRLRDAETAFQSAATGPDTELGLMAVVNLGAVLESQPERFPEAEEAYRRAIASQHPVQAPMAAANLGTLLVAIPGREDEAESLLEAAASSGAPQHAVRATFNLGILLLGRPGRRDEAEAAFRTVAASGDPDHAAKGAYNLGRLLAEDPNRLDEARKALRDVAALDNPEAAVLAANLLAQLSGETPDQTTMQGHTVQLRERPCVDVDRLGLRRLTIRSTDAGDVLEEYVPNKETLDTLTELLTLTSALDHGVTLRTIATAIDTAVAGRVVDGTYAFTVISEGDDELVCGWTLERDAIADDQAERSRIVRSGFAVHVVTYTVRATVERAMRRLDEVWPLVETAPFVHAPIPEPAPVSAPSTELLELLDRLADPGHGSASEREDWLRQAQALVDRQAQPELWSTMQIAAGIQAREHSPQEAISTLRRGLQKADPQSTMWPLGVAHLARAYGLDAPDHAIGLLERAIPLLSQRSTEWAEAVFDLGSIYEEIGEFDAATRCYGQVLEEMGTATRPLPDDDAALSPAMAPYVRASMGVKRVDQLRAGSPFVEQPPIDLDWKGQLVYLRPFVSKGGLTVANGFPGGDWYVAKDGREPETMTLEAVLHRALGYDLQLLAVGGQGEAYGMARLAILSKAGEPEWQETVTSFVESADFVLLVPHRSEGVRWEIALLTQSQAIERTLIIMPPRSDTFDTHALWEGAVPLLTEHDILTPPYDPQGLILRCAPGRGVIDAWPFTDLFDGTLVNRILAEVDRHN
jgi:tetratricopeptide (TPR) repeat protein